MLEFKYGVDSERELARQQGFYGGEYRALTESEGRAILHAKGLDEARDRIAAGRQAAGIRAQSQVLPGPVR